VRPVLFSLGAYDFFAAPAFAGFAALLASIYFWRFRAHAGLSEEDYWQLMALLAVTTISGAVLHFFLLHGGGFSTNLAWVLKNRAIQGGAFYGNLWGGVLGILLFARLKKKPLPHLADLLGISAVLALVFMRLGCLQSGCCHGTPTELPLSITFLDPRAGIPSRLRGTPLHPVQLYEMLASLILFLFAHFRILARISKKKIAAGSAFLVSIGLYSAIRFLLEFIRASDRGLISTTHITTTQFLAAGTVATVLLMTRVWKHGD